MRPFPLDHFEVDVHHRAIEIEKASRKFGDQQRRADRGCETEKIVHMGVGGEQHQLVRHRVLEIRKRQAAMGRIEHHRDGRRCRRNDFQDAVDLDRRESQVGHRNLFHAVAA
jgi:hypothetical protein